MSSKKHAILLCYQGLLDMEDSEKLENFMSCMGHACKCSFCLEEVTICNFYSLKGFIYVIRSQVIYQLFSYLVCYR